MRSRSRASSARRGRRSLALLLEVRSHASIRVCFERLQKEWGRIDVLVNNAGTNVPADLASLEDDAWDTVVDTDLKGLAFVTQAAVPLLTGWSARVSRLREKSHRVALKSARPDGGNLAALPNASQMSGRSGPEG